MKTPPFSSHHILQLLKTVGMVLLLFMAGGIGYTTYRFNTYSPQPVTPAVNPDNLIYFQESYGECRRQFIDAAQNLAPVFQGVEIAAIKIDSQTEADLFIDYCHVPAQKKKKKLMILTSGVHGIEGYMGSALQQMALRELMTRNRMDDMGILLIHGINPYGFKKNRRVTEKNIDLNRNCSMDRRLYDSVNKGYGRLNAWLNPKQKVNLTRFDHFFFPFNMAFKIARHSMATLRQAILQGQYQYKNGIYFGGKALEPSIKAITPLVKKISQNYEMVLGIDIHTGYGTNGKLYLFPSPMTDERKKAQIESIFPQGPIDWGDEKNFYTVTGDFVTYLGQILPDKDSLTLAFEFGTLDTETAMGSIKALHNVIIENQGAQHNYTSQRDEKMVRKRYLQSYYPDSEAWRSKAIEDARTTLVKALQNFKAVP